MPPIMIAVVDIFALLLLFTLFLCHIYSLMARKYFNCLLNFIYYVMIIEIIYGEISWQMKLIMN